MERRGEKETNHSAPPNSDKAAKTFIGDCEAEAGVEGGFSALLVSRTMTRS
jgi:hypothetical protein